MASIVVEHKPHILFRFGTIEAGGHKHIKSDGEPSRGWDDHKRRKIYFFFRTTHFSFKYRSKWLRCTYPPTTLMGYKYGVPDGYQLEYRHDRMSKFWLNRNFRKKDDRSLFRLPSLVCLRRVPLFHQKEFQDSRLQVRRQRLLPLRHGLSYSLLFPSEILYGHSNWQYRYH